MSKDLTPEEAIQARYPLTLKRVYGFECGAGWYPLLTKLFDKLEAELASMPVEIRETYEVVQVKEKFGGLRVYTAQDETETIAAAIREAEAEAWRTCEVCSEPGELNRKGWWRGVRCPVHVAQ